MTIPALETLPRLLEDSDVSRWSEDLTRDLERQLRDFLLPFTEIQLVNGNNANVNVKGSLFAQISGPTLAFTITGIAGGAPGKILLLYNSTTQNMSIAHESVVSAEANRIRTMSGATLTLNGESMALFFRARTRWLLFATTF